MVPVGTFELVDTPAGPTANRYTDLWIEEYIPNERLAGVAVVRNLEGEGAIRG